ncbi:MAG: TetR/AcrR family transcriptional regulator [Salinivirgaceae bacterium]|nr:TetR/AcrR family transcriptional regulator [Salinivirgaceae bacterium]
MELLTFQNLSPERKEEIIQTSFAEFALKGYESASLSEIIKRLGLAKGSFYRYFSSKKDLYAYLIQNASERRLSKLDNLIEQPGIDFFEVIRQNFFDKLKFDLENPVIGGFLYQVMHERDNNEVADLIGGLYTSVIKITQSIIELDKFKKQLKIQDSEIVAFQVFHMQLWLYDYVAYKYKIDYHDNIKRGQPVLNLSDVELNRVIDVSISMLKNGI